MSIVFDMFFETFIARINAIHASQNKLYQKHMFLTLTSCAY